MDRPTDSAPAPSRSRQRRILLLPVAILAVGAPLFALISWLSPPAVSLHKIDPGSNYANTHPGTRYVGDAACVDCHREISDRYQSHPMGRSLVPVALAPSTGSDEFQKSPLFQAQGLDYWVENRGGSLIHVEARRDGAGREIARREGTVQFVVGSGKLGFAYLIERDGFLFQSPIAWYARARQWDLPPGYQANNPHFDRPIQSTCLYCHANHALAVEGTVNRYESPFFQGHAIGCERCHGPGELHVGGSRPTSARDLTIVNPANLEPALRDAVCAQCHLNGQRRVLRAGRRDDDFRPGLPFQRFWTVLEPAASTTVNKFVGQFEQMQESRCFQGSQGKLGCISCHDPHRLPSPQEKPAYYRDRCLECHQDRGCSLPAPDRARGGQIDDCVRCHMPPLSSSNIIHVAETNHQVPRDGRESHAPAATSGGSRPGGRHSPWLVFHRALMDEADLAHADREIAMVICHDGPEGARAALPVLMAALDESPADVPALEAKGFALGQLGRGDEGLAAFRAALALEPGRESALTGASFVAAQAGRLDDAIAYCQRAIALSPDRAVYRAELASLYFRNRDWAAAARTCLEALKLNPADLEIRRLLVRTQIRQGDVSAARASLETLVAFDPPDRAELLRSFAKALNLDAR